MSSALKKIDITALQVGMYIHDLSCDWMTHPFVRNRFLITSPAEIAKIRNAGIHDIVIDTGKGLDVAGSATLQESAENTEHEVMRAASAAPPPVIRTSYAEELTRAVRIRDQAASVVRSVMNDIRLGKAIDIGRVQPVVQDITESILRNPGALLGLLQIKDKDDYTFLHSVSVCALLVAFCHHRGMAPELIREAGIGGLLHDTGKALVPDAVLNKPGRLTDEEFEVIRQHPVDGFRILSESGLVGPIPLDITRHHHERMDGSGYPDKLQGYDISDLAQMAAIVDVYDALTADRCYHQAMPAAEALRKLFEWSKFHFRPDLVQDFMRCVGIYPLGTLVRLASDRLAVVYEPTPGKPLLPKVNVFFNIKANVYIKPCLLDLARPQSAQVDKIASHEAPEKWKVDPRRFLPAC
jgi:HD-GYP domain-containing protein (c-di-GMP phosphodiesterase class II)